MRTARPVIEEEAYFKGNIETVRAEAPKAPPQRPQAAEAPQQPSLPNVAPPAGETRRG